MVFLTGLMAMLGQYGDFFTGNLLGTQQGVLSGYNCPASDAGFEVSPVPQLLGYTKGNTEANRKEFQRINLKNHGLTAWYTYDMGFNQSLKSSLIDSIAYMTDSNQYLTTVYNAIANHGSPHGAMDLVTKWLSPDNINLPTVYPYAQGYVVEAAASSGGYGNYVSVCTDVSLSNGEQMRVLYTVAHLNSINVQEGQMVSANTQLGTIGNTGRSSTPHAHIAIMPDLIWQPNYREVYNAGYKSFFPTSLEGVLAKTIDPVAVMLNPSIAYSIVEDSSRQQAVFNAPSQYIASLTGLASTDTDNLLVSNGTASIIDVPLFTDFNILVDKDSAKTGDWVTVTVEAVDQDGNYYPAFEEAIRLVLSSPTAKVDQVGQMKAGRTSFRVQDTNPGDVVIQISNSGSVSEEKKIAVVDRVKYLEVTAPQKTTVGTQVAVSLRPIGTQGGVIAQSLVASVQVFPVAGDQGNMVINNGRGEFLFTPEEEGIYQLSFSSEGIQESIQIVAQELVIPGAGEEEVPDEDPVVPEEEVPVESGGENGALEEDAVSDDKAEDNQVDSTPDVSEENADDTEEVNLPSDDSEVLQDLEEQDSQDNQLSDLEGDIKILTGEQYVIHDRDGKLLLVFNDADVGDELYPVEMRFTVPEGTQNVSIFTGLNDRNFPVSGELKLSKYTPGQDYVRYYSKYLPENAYKKIVAYDSQGSEIHSQVYTWSPASLHVFTDVIEGITDDEVYEAIMLLKEAGVVNGNPDGSYGVDTPINRAAVATILIRAFYSDVDLNTLAFGGTDFSDVPGGSWYESAMWFASQAEYEGATKPIIIKGYNGKANPDGLVKLEELLTMVLRVLELNLEASEPWYEFAIALSVELGLIQESERSLIDQPLSRGLVARILVKALELIEEGVIEIVQNDQALKAAAEAPESADLAAEEAVEEEVVPEPVVVVPRPAATDIQYTFGESGLALSWESDLSGPYSVYRETVGGNGQILLGSTGGKAFTDISAKIGHEYYYRIDAQGEGVEKAEKLIILE